MPSQRVLEEKKRTVAELKEKLQNAVSAVFVDYCGLSVAQDTELRNKLREANVEYRVVKNTLTRFAAKELGLDELDEILNGPTSLAVSMTDEVAPAKILAEFAKKNEQLEIKSGLLDGKVISIEEIKTLADTPSRDVLIARIMGSLNSPASKLARTLQALVDNGVEPSEIQKGAPAAAEEAPAPTEEAPSAAAEETPAQTEEAPPAAEETADQEPKTEE
ncbi:MAG: 50S ribosomal protein L10 [Clostridia bacterium]|nr:50S ribosomal protein L10 [Clostridia bacterium]